MTRSGDGPLPIEARTGHCGDSPTGAPTNRHHRGVRGEPTAGITDALRELARRIDAHLAALRRIRSPQVRLEAAVASLECLRSKERSATEIRDTTIAALVRDGASYGQVAERCGLTRGRVSQLVHRAPEA